MTLASAPTSSNVYVLLAAEIVATMVMICPLPSEILIGPATFVNVIELEVGLVMRAEVMLGPVNVPELTVGLTRVGVIIVGEKKFPPVNPALARTLVPLKVAVVIRQEVRLEPVKVPEEHVGLTRAGVITVGEKKFPPVNPAPVSTLVPLKVAVVTRQEVRFEPVKVPDEHVGLTRAGVITVGEKKFPPVNPAPVRTLVPLKIAVVIRQEVRLDPVNVPELVVGLTTVGVTTNGDRRVFCIKVCARCVYTTLVVPTRGSGNNIVVPPSAGWDIEKNILNSSGPKVI